MLFISIFLLCSEIGKGKEIPPCSCSPHKWLRSGEPINKFDDIVIDTCGTPTRNNMRNCDSIFFDIQTHKPGEPISDTLYDRILSKGIWRVIMPEGSLNLPIYPIDTIIYLSIDDIDTSFHDLIDGFKSFEYKYGAFYMRKFNPSIIDGLTGRTFHISFDSWLKVRLVEGDLKKIQGLDCEFINWPVISGIAGIPDQSQSPYNLSINTDNTILHISSNAEPIINYAIYNLQGNAISQSNNINYQNALDIDISALSNGIYFLRILAPNQQFHLIKFIKE
jgi:hypothetical protein